MAESKLTSALIAALEDPESAGQRIREAGEAVSTPGEAELIIRLLKLFPLPPNSSAKRALGFPLQIVLVRMLEARGEEVIRVFRELGGPELLRIFDEAMRVPVIDDKWIERNERLFLLKIICMYFPERGLERLVAAARSPSLKKGSLWSTIFSMVSSENHPWQAAIIEALRDPLPDGFRAVAYLDLCNAVARSGKLTRHPFSTEDGLALLQVWLLDETNSGYAHSAAASLPFLPPEVREKVQALADRHPDRGIQMEAAWPAATCLEYQLLKGLSAIPQGESTGTGYWIGLDAEDRIP